jgi:hypothetical protein
MSATHSWCAQVRIDALYAIDGDVAHQQLSLAVAPRANPVPRPPSPVHRPPSSSWQCLPICSSNHCHATFRKENSKLGARTIAWLSPTSVQVLTGGHGLRRIVGTTLAQPSLAQGRTEPVPVPRLTRSPRWGRGGGYDATVARLTPYQKVGNSNGYAVIFLLTTRATIPYIFIYMYIYKYSMIV